MSPLFILAAATNVLALLSSNALANVTTSDLDLNCKGQIVATKIGAVVHHVKTTPTRTPTPHFVHYSTAPVTYQIVQASGGCEKAAAQFKLPFKVAPGNAVHAILEKFGHLTYSEMFNAAELGKTYPFAIQQNFYSATTSGQLPAFPLFNVESITFQLGNGVPNSYDVAFQIGGDNQYNYKFLDQYEEYGIKNPAELSVTEKMVQVEKVIQLAKKSDLADPEVVKVITEALSSMVPSKFQDFKDGDPSYQIALKSYLGLTLPFLDAYTAKYSNLKIAPEGIQSVFSSILYKLTDLLPPFESTLDDSLYVIKAFAQMPLVLQANTGNVLYLAPESVEKILIQMKTNLVSANKNKTQQIKSVTAFLLSSFENAKYAPQYPLTATSKGLITDILAAK